MSDANAPMGKPGDILNWPMLKIRYKNRCREHRQVIAARH